MRNLANLPGNVCTPTYLGKTAAGPRQDPQVAAR